MYKDIINNIELYKTSQWFILTRKDTKILLDTRNKYKNYFLNLDIKNVAYDEIYFLTVLYLENKNYTYNHFTNIYVRWLHPSKHPIIFNKLTKNDKQFIREEKSLFIRKVTDSFRLKTKKTRLYIITIGYLTDQNYVNNFMIKNINRYDFIICSLIEIDKLIISNKWLYYYYVYYSNYEKWIIDMCDNMINNKLFEKYNQGILFIPEVFNLYEINYNLNNILDIDLFFDNYLLYEINDKNNKKGKYLFIL
jgi:hypothetical protein